MNKILLIVCLLVVSLLLVSCTAQTVDWSMKSLSNTTESNELGWSVSYTSIVLTEERAYKLYESEKVCFID